MELWGTPNPIGRVNGTRLRMLRKILADGMQTVAELADALCMEQRAVRDNATQAVKAGLLAKCLDDVTKTLAYSITQSGREYVISRDHESAEPDGDNAASEALCADTPTQQAPEDVATRPMPPSDTEEESAAEESSGQPGAEAIPSTASSDDIPDEYDGTCPALSTAEMLRVIMAITKDPLFTMCGVDPSAVHPVTTQAPVTEEPPDTPQERSPSSVAECVENIRSTGAYAFARFENGQAVVEWITPTADDAFNELKTSNRDAIVFKVIPVAMAQRTVTFVD